MKTANPHVVGTAANFDVCFLEFGSHLNTAVRCDSERRARDQIEDVQMLEFHPRWWTIVELRARWHFDLVLHTGQLLHDRFGDLCIGFAA